MSYIINVFGRTAGCKCNKNKQLIVFKMKASITRLMGTLHVKRLQITAFIDVGPSIQHLVKKEWWIFK